MPAEHGELWIVTRKVIGYIYSDKEPLESIMRAYIIFIYLSKLAERIVMSYDRSSVDPAKVV